MRNSAWVANLAALCFAGTAVAGAAERLTLSRYSIDAPVGWTSQLEGDRWVVHPTGGAAECAIAAAGPAIEIGPNMPLTEARRQLWANATRSRRIAQIEPTQEDKDASGRLWSVDAALVEESGFNFVLALAVVELSGRAEGFLIVATPQGIERHQAAVDAVLHSVRDRPSAAAAPRNRKPSLPSAIPHPLGSPSAGRLAGVWTATTQELKVGLGGLASGTSVSELILFADGTALWGMPGEGLIGFDRAADRARSPQRWGNYKLRDKRLTISRAGEARQYALLPDGALERRYVEDGKERIGERLLPRPSPDGLRLSGEIRRRDHWPAPGNSSGIGTLRGCTFFSDGTFRDEKLMWIVLPERVGQTKAEHEARVLPGKGRYRFEHWTLVLEYDDGRVNQVSFIATNREHPARGAIVNGYAVEPKPE